jgi:hypothetical protein
MPHLRTVIEEALWKKHRERFDTLPEWQRFVKDVTDLIMEFRHPDAPEKVDGKK